LGDKNFSFWSGGSEAESKPALFGKANPKGAALESRAVVEA